ncbi:hypothetical protein C0J52_16530 [Blattella germanica]|nr:hypothetical protein C0J52_16530 [Blattella germanica]
MLAQSDESGIHLNRVVVISLNSAMARYSLRKRIFIFKSYSTLGIESREAEQDKHLNVNFLNGQFHHEEQYYR